jgi:hypothetical protein
MILFYLRTNRDRLVGIFTDEAKAELAAVAYCKQFWGASPEIHRYDVEVHYVVDAQSLILDRWMTDKAYIDGNWVVL